MTEHDWLMRLARGEAMTIADAFLADILANSADDVPRLIYADWLEGHGQEERGEFIRVQIELAENQRAIAAGKQDSDVVKWMNKHDRERKLFANSGPAWWNSLPGSYRATEAADISITTAEGMKYLVRRGFVECFEGRLEHWIGETCTACRGWMDYGGIKCPACHGTGRANAHGPAIMACQPVTRVVCLDIVRCAEAMGNSWTIWRGSGEEDIPAFLFSLLERGPCQDPAHIQAGTHAHFGNEQAAFDAISAALISWAKGVWR